MPMKFEAVRDHIVTTYRAGLRQTIYLEGAPGVGKSASAKAAADILRHDNPEFAFHALQMTVVDPLDFGGLPAVITTQDGPKAVRLPFTDLIPQSGAGIVLYDDLPTAPPLTQAAAYRTIYERDSIGPDWLIVATGNRAQDRAATQRMPTPLVSKMCHLEFEPDIDGWQAEMAARGRSSAVRAFIAHRPALFVTFDPARPGPFATARTWEGLAELVDAYAGAESGRGRLPPFEALRGWVGEGPAAEFAAFAEMAAQLVSPDEVLADPAKAPVPTEPGALYAIATALSDITTAETIDKVLIYLRRLQPEFAIYTIKAANAAERGRLSRMTDQQKSKVRPIATTGAFVKFAGENQDLLKH